MARIMSVQIYNPPEGLHRKLRLFADERDTTMSAVAVKALLDFIRRTEESKAKAARSEAQRKAHAHACGKQHGKAQTLEP